MYAQFSKVILYRCSYNTKSIKIGNGKRKERKCIRIKVIHTKNEANSLHDKFTTKIISFNYHSLRSDAEFSTSKKESYKNSEIVLYEYGLSNNNLD